MRIACPACNATYEVPDTEMRAERIVRCARCGTDWAPIAAIAEPVETSLPSARSETPALVLPEAPAMPERQMALDEDRPLPPPVIAPVIAVSRPVATGRQPVLVMAWVLSVLAVGSGLGLLVVQRDRVMAMWPPSIRGYAALGLAARP